MLRGKVHELAEGPFDLGIDSHAVSKSLATVDDPVADRLDLWQFGEDRSELLATTFEGGEVVGSQDLVVRVKDAQLEAAGAGVDG